ncbi:hypothetical protein [Colwellia sp. Bg11-28]|uniref:hypothetical protein n=1 Tax=Colwellia sp. Bg11-28 TaxID=2058305 RepID=UPI000C34978C|nr:hypothetical protein [Colwellia sp. Bg11-28]PKH88376.1 hypothetical protein CXF79_06355 [Colwellia sp. Bg11-28]
MRNKLLTSALVMIFSWQVTSVNAEKTLWSQPIFDQPESALLNSMSNEILISNINGGALELNGKGYISRVSTSGELLQKHWVKELDAPKGMGLFGQKLYIADMQKLHVVDTTTGKIITSYFAGNSKMLNDVSIDEGGNVYVSDILGGSIYRLKGGKFEKWFSTPLIEHPNGLLVDKGSLYVANWGQGLHEDFSTDELGKIYRLSLLNPYSQIEVISGALGNLDGLVSHKGQFIVNDWVSGNVFRIHNGQSELLFNAGKGVADIGIYQGELLLPMMFDNRIDSYKLD